MTQPDPQVMAFSPRSGPREANLAEDSSTGILEAFWRYRWSSLLITLVALAVTAGVGLQLAPGAQATAVLGLSTPPPGNVLAPDIQGEASLARYVEQRAGFVTSDAVLATASQRLGRESVASLRDKVEAEASSTSNAINLTVTSSTPRDAVELADAVVWAYTEETRKEVTRLSGAAVAAIEQNVIELEWKILAGNNATVNAGNAEAVRELQLQALEIERESELFGGGIEFVNAPSLDSAREPGLPTREIGVGLILGLVVAATIAWIRADHAARSGRGPRARSLFR
jgi:succinoglycan biosynthesis transport protein ExoP